MEVTSPRTASAQSHPCRCVKVHVPKVNRTQLHHIWPMGMGGPDVSSNIVAVCPTTHSEVHLILERFDRARSVSPKRRGEGQYAYDLAVQGWEAAR